MLLLLLLVLVLPGAAGAAGVVAVAFLFPDVFLNFYAKSEGGIYTWMYVQASKRRGGG